MLPSLSGNKKKKNYCQVLFLEMCSIIKTGRIHFFKFVLLTRPYFVGILHPNSSEQKELWYPWQAQLICSKLEILSWRLVSCLHIRHGSQILMCHLPPWLEAASLACNHPVSRKPSRSRPALNTPALHSGQTPTLTKHPLGCLLGRQWRMSWYCFLPQRRSCPDEKGRRCLAKAGKRQRAILERQV